MDEGITGKVGRLIAWTGYTMKEVMDLSERFPRVFLAAVREVEARRGRQWATAASIAGWEGD